MEKNPYNPITEPASHKWWEETKKGTLTIAHQKKLTHEEQVEANEKLLVKIKEDVISLGERLIAKNQELSELQEKYNKLKEEKEEWEQSFDLYHNALKRGETEYIKGHPEYPKHTLPDTATVIKWLCDRIESQDEKYNTDLYNAKLKLLDEIRGNIMRQISKNPHIYVEQMVYHQIELLEHEINYLEKNRVKAGLKEQ